MNKYGVLFTLFGGILAAYGPLFGGWAWLLVWPAASFFLVGLAYLGLGPRVFGKRANGRLSWWSPLVVGPYIAALWATWFVMRLVTREPAYNEVAPNLFVGRRPLANDAPPDAALVVDMTAEFRAAPLDWSRTTYLTLPTLDTAAPPEADFDRIVALAAIERGPVLIHCGQGHGRAAMLAAAVLVARGLAEDAAEAERILK
ncbi:MAG TPA: phosphatase, partial [Pirellulales bacterium]